MTKSDKVTVQWRLFLKKKKGADKVNHDTLISTSDHYSITGIVNDWIYLISKTRTSVLISVLSTLLFVAVFPKVYF